MPLLSSPVPSLVGGVSQQTPAARLASELETQENAYSSIVEGLGKRSPTVHTKRLSTADLSDAFFHPINLSLTERYELVITDGDLFVYDMATGEAKSVAFPDGKDYLAGASSEIMRALTVADYTFIVNSTHVTAMSGIRSTPNLGKALVSVKQGQYSTTYTIKLDGQEATSYVTSDSDITKLRTDYIAQQLVANITNNASLVVTTATFLPFYAPTGIHLWTNVINQVGAFSTYTWHAGDTITITGGTGAIVGTYAVTEKLSNDKITIAADISGSESALLTGDITSTSTDFSSSYTFTRSGSSIYITKNNGTAIDIAVEDSYGNRALTVASSVVQRFTDLPVVAPTGFTTKVTGDNAAEEDDYYVTFVPLEASQTFANGNWVETIGPDTETTLDTSTMPHTLIREADGTFTFQQGAWGARTVGDTTSCPDPSFIGSTIQDIFFFRNRLGVLSGENVICSVAGGFFKFFRETVTTILDSDPIDLASTQNHVSLLKRALPFQEQLLLFTDDAQLVMTSPGLLTPNTATINQATDYQADLTAKPVGAGSNIYFGFSRGTFSGLREYFVEEGNVNTKGASDVTGHVPKYILGTITRLTATTSESVVAALADGLPNGFYVYKFYWVNDQKVQSSWSEFLFEDGAQVLSADFINSTLHLVVQRSDGAHLETMQFQDGQTDTDSAFVTLLDRRLDETGVVVTYNPSNNTTSWELPYEVTDTMKVAVRAGDGSLSEGVSIPLTSQVGTTLTATGDFTDTKVFIGQTYRMTVELSEPFMRQPSPNGGSLAIIDGKCQVKNITVGFNDSANFETHVALPGRDTTVKPYTSLAIGVGSTGSVRLADGVHRAMVGSDSKRTVVRLISDSHLPCRFSTASWEMHFTQRSQRA